MSEEKSEDVVILEAMEKAEEAFNQHIEGYGWDYGFFELGMRAYKLTESSFLPYGHLDKEPEWKQRHDYKDVHVEHWKLKDESGGVDDLYA